MTKKYDSKQVAKIMVKAMKKAFKKVSKKNPVEDVLDHNFTPESKEKDIPPAVSGVMYKSKPLKLKQFLNKKKTKKKDKEES
jgi:hypothetical protein